MTFAGFELPDELVDLRRLVRDFVRERIRPEEDRLEPGAAHLPVDVLDKLRDEARAIGLWCLDAPQEYGGGGLTAFQHVVFLEEACKHRFCFPHAGGGVFGQSPPVVLYNSSEVLTDKYVRPTILAGWTSFTAIAEASGGSDPAGAIHTTAHRDGDSYVLNGRKMWITNADRARYGVVYARAEEGITAFVVDSDVTGLTTASIPVIRNHWPTELVLNDVRVPVANRVGREGQGLALAAKWLVRGRLAYAARAIGVASESLRLAVEWMHNRETFGVPLAGNQGLQWQVAEAEVEIRAGRALTWEAAWKEDQGQDARLEAAIAKLYCTEVGFKVVDRAMQLLGAMGMASEMPLESWLRDLRVARVVEGTSELLRNQIARKVVGKPASRR